MPTFKLNNLTEIDLSSNKLEFIASGLFDNLPSLRRIILYGNELINKNLIFINEKQMSIDEFGSIVYDGDIGLDEKDDDKLRKSMASSYFEKEW